MQNHASTLFPSAQPAFFLASPAPNDIYVTQISRQSSLCLEPGTHLPADKSQPANEIFVTRANVNCWVDAPLCKCCLSLQGVTYFM